MERSDLLIFLQRTCWFTNFIASTQYDNIVVHDASKDRRSIQAEEPSSSVRLHLPFSRINESIPKAQMGYVYPSTPSNERVMSHATPLNIIQNSIQLTALILSNIFSPWWKVKHGTPRTPLCRIYPPCSIQGRHAQRRERALEGEHIPLLESWHSLGSTTRLVFFPSGESGHAEATQCNSP